MNSSIDSKSSFEIDVSLYHSISLYDFDQNLGCYVIRRVCNSFIFIHANLKSLNALIDVDC